MSTPDGSIRKTLRRYNSRGASKFGTCRNINGCWNGTGAVDQNPEKEYDDKEVFYDVRPTAPNSDVTETRLRWQTPRFWDESPRRERLSGRCDCGQPIYVCEFVNLTIKGDSSCVCIYHVLLTTTNMESQLCLYWTLIISQTSALLVLNHIYFKSYWT